MLWLSSNETWNGAYSRAVVAAAGGEIDAAVAEQVERRPLLGDADRMVQRQHGDGRREPDVLGARRDIGQHQLGAGQHAERVEMMLADPGRMHAELVGVERLGGDVGDELVGVARVVLVVIVAEREVAEFHGSPPPACAACRGVAVGFIVTGAIVVNAIVGNMHQLGQRLLSATALRQGPPAKTAPISISTTTCRIWSIGSASRWSRASPPMRWTRTA